MPDVSSLLNWGAIGVSVLAMFVLGFLWYGPVFGKAWAKEMGFDMDMKPEPSFMVKAMLLQLLGSFLTAYVLAHSVLVWQPSTWGNPPIGGEAPDGLAAYGFFAAIFTWVGYYIPQHLNLVTWEMKSWKLFFINAGYSFVSLQIVGQILANWA